MAIFSVSRAKAAVPDPARRTRRPDERERSDPRSNFNAFFSPNRAAKESRLFELDVCSNPSRYANGDRNESLVACVEKCNYESFSN